MYRVRPLDGGIGTQGVEDLCFEVGSRHLRGGVLQPHIGGVARLEEPLERPPGAASAGRRREDHRAAQPDQQHERQRGAALTHELRRAHAQIGVMAASHPDRGCPSQGASPHRRGGGTTRLRS